MKYKFSHHKEYFQSGFKAGQNFFINCLPTYEKSGMKRGKPQAFCDGFDFGYKLAKAHSAAQR